MTSNETITVTADCIAVTVKSLMTFTLVQPPSSHARRADAQNIDMLGEVVDDLGVGDVVGKLKGVDVGVNVLVVGVGDVEVDVGNLDAAGFEILVDVFDGFHAVDEANLQLLRHAHMDDALHQNQHEEHEDAAADRDHIVAVADRNAQTGGVPKGRGGGQTGDLAVGEENRARAEETDAADNLRAQTTEVVGDGGIGFTGKAGGEEGFDQGNRARTKADQNVRAYAGRPAFDLALNADDRSDQYGQRDAKDDDGIFHGCPLKKIKLYRRCRSIRFITTL